ncbi:TRAP transporter substrate-binding protein [Desulfosporosinus burensis]
MKKNIFSISLVLLLVMSMVGCMAQKPTVSQNSNPTSTIEASAPVFNLKLQAHLSGAQLERLIGPTLKLIEKETNGTVKITPYGGGVLMPVPEMLRALTTGSLDMAMFAEGYFSGVIPVSEIGQGLPYGYRNLHEAWIFMWQRGYLDILRQEYAKQNVHVIPFEAFNVGLMTKKPIERFGDLKGLKLRSGGGMSMWESEAGSSVVMIPGAELYTALATGVIDGASWGDAGPMYEMKFQEVLKNYMLPDPVQGAWNNLYFNMDVWNKFTPGQRKAIEAAVLNGSRAGSEQTRTMYNRALDSMVEDFGVKVNTLSEEEQAKGKEAAIKVWDKIAAKDPINAKVISMLKEFHKERLDAKNVSPKFGDLSW